ncbi:rhamnosyltransferase [Marmoricola sp. URHA0025 HA25]
MHDPAASSPGEPPRQVHALVVSFNPGPKLASLVETLRHDGLPVSVVDNGSSSGLTDLDACTEMGATVAFLGENTGIAGALSAGERLAAPSDWLLTFDQDSVIEPGFVHQLLSSEAVADESVAIVAPCIFDDRSGNVLQGRIAEISAHRVPLAMTSGALTRRTALKAVGGYREELFIDHVDHDICLRLRRAGYSIALEPKARMRHSVGSMSEHHFGTLTIRASHHAADRQYYKYRNFVLILRSRIALIDTPWALRTVVSLVVAPLKILAFEKDKVHKLAAVVAGLRDGIMGRGGRRPRRTQQ